MAEVERLAKDGWQLVPGVQPIAIYNLVRQKNMPVSAPAPVSPQAGMGTLGIDDSKIFMMRDGKLVS